VHVDDADFEKLLTAALYRASELDCVDMPTDEELDRIIQPSPQFTHKMNALLRNPHKYIRNQRKSKYLKALQSAAAVFIVVTVVLGVTMVFSPTVRAAVVNYVRSWFEDRTQYITPERDSDTELSFDYIPEGFEQVLLQEDGSSSIRIYQNADLITISITVTKGKQVLDNEHHVFYETVINAREADVYESIDPQYPNMIVIFDDATGNIVTITSELDLSSLILIAKNIK